MTINYYNLQTTNYKLFLLLSNSKYLGDISDALQSLEQAVLNHSHHSRFYSQRFYFHCRGAFEDQLLHRIVHYENFKNPHASFVPHVMAGLTTSAMIKLSFARYLFLGIG